MTKAAKQLNIVQPALSRSINSLEKELGVDLFDRNGRFIKLNDNGRSFLDTVNKTLNTLENGKKILMDMNDKECNEIKLLLLSGSDIVPDLIYQFKNLYPHATFKLIQHAPEDIDSVDFDFCISTTLERVLDPCSITLLEEEMLLGVSLNHPLSNKDCIFLEEVSNEDFIGFVRNKPFRDISDKLCSYAGFTPNIVFESDVSSIVYGLIKAGVGIGFIPEVSWNKHRTNDVKLLHIVDPPCNRYLNLSWNKDSYLTNISKLFRDFSVDYYSKL